MIVKQIYDILRKNELVSTMEEYSVDWLMRHKSTASYLVHKKRDLSIGAKISLLSKIKAKITSIYSNQISLSLNPNLISNLKIAETIIAKDIEKMFNLQIKINNT
jgi:hypothetical protein